MTGVSFYPTTVEAGRKLILEQLVALLNDVERPLRRVDLPAMPGGLRGSVQGQINAAIATMSTARVGLARLAGELRALAEVMQQIDGGLTIVSRMGSVAGALPDSQIPRYLEKLYLDFGMHRLRRLQQANAAADAVAAARLDPGASKAYISALENRLAALTNNSSKAQKVLWDNFMVKYLPGGKFPPGAAKALNRLDRAFIPLNLYLGYRGSSAQTRPARALSAAGGTALTYNPPGAVMEVVTGGALSSGYDGLVVAATEGTFVGPGMENWNAQNLNGDNGWMLQSYSQAGDLATPATTTVLNTLGGENWPFTDDDATIDWVPFL